MSIFEFIAYILGVMFQYITWFLRLEIDSQGTTILDMMIVLIPLFIIIGIVIHLANREVVGARSKVYRYSENKVDDFKERRGVK